MSIKKGETITASDISSLKQAVIDIYSARPNLGGTSTSGAQYTVSSINANSSGFGSDETKRAITTGNTINANFYYALNALLQLNNVITTDTTPVTIISSSNTTGDHIFKDVNENKDLMTVVNSWKNLGLASTAQPISCRGGCVGLCWNKCDSTCTYNCKGENVTGAGGDGSHSGWGTQTGNNCSSGSCSGQCRSSCKTVCYESCNSGCKAVCGQGGCTGSCTKDCRATCNGVCIGSGDSIMTM